MDPEDPEHLVEHRAVLRRDAYQALELLRRRLQRVDHRRHLDRLRPSAEDAEDADHRLVATASSRSANVCMVTKRKPRSSAAANTRRSTASRTPS
jgi:hypothetical protein